jgi:hypothetical protein
VVVCFGAVITEDDDDDEDEVAFRIFSFSFLRNLSTSPKPFFRSVPADFILVYLLTRKKKEKGEEMFLLLDTYKKKTDCD